MKRKLAAILSLIVLSGIMAIGCSNASEGNSSDNSNASENAASADQKENGSGRVEQQNNKYQRRRVKR